MQTFRSWTRRAWILHGYLLATLFLPPFPLAHSFWSDTDGDGAPDAWTGQNNTTQSMAQLDAQNADIDGDGAYNEEELAYGSDPLDYDTDNDGLNDGDEIHLAILQSGRAFSLTSWDSNGDFVSDFDDFYNFFGVTYSGGELPNFAGASYSDYDGDDIKNPYDAYPADPLNNDTDRDGLDDRIDPVLGDPSNTSPYNSIAWGSSALGDADTDAILNFWDQWPNDATNGSNDSDGDTLTNDIDPFPTDYSNYSPLNQINWNGDVLGDADTDGVQNYADQWPYDSMNGASSNDGSNPDDSSSSNDSDSDGITNDLDPATADPNNYSSVNNYSWYGLALEDADNDGTSNFNDPFPYDPYNNLPDFDGDGWANADDPFPTDATNFSSFNQAAWGGGMFDDADSDGTPNWQDEHPYDPYNDNPDFDGDTILNEADPYPTDGSNYSSYNLISWGSNALGDDDGDGALNWQDVNPYPITDTTLNNNADGDGYDDSNDPAPNDSSNTSPYNGLAWNSGVFGDADADGTQNYWDQWPYDSTNGNAGADSDGDGILNSYDPAPGDPTNYSSYNGQSWYSGALGDGDNDGTANFYDYQPYGDNNSDSDGDGLLDTNDPAPNDSTNYSSLNYQSWGSDALNDTDSDGTQNFYDPTPYGNPPPVDNDGDGLYSDEEAARGTSDSNVDSDGDTLSDGAEVHTWGSNPANPRSISQSRGWGDLYSDADLVDTTDTDADGIPDRIELHYGLNPNWAVDAFLDRDNNGTNNVTQYLAGMALDANLSSYDADGDGMTDVFEDGYQLAKNNYDDAILDADGDGVLNYEEQRLLTSPQHADTLQQGTLGDLQVLMLSVRYSDGSNPQADDNTPANGIPDWADAVKASPTAPDYAHFTRQLATDLDGDGMPDAWEHKYGAWKYTTGGLNLRDARDALKDPDHDGLNNLTEYRFGSDPLAGDSLGDGVLDSTRLYQKTHSTTTTGGGLMSRYRAQVVQELAAGSSASRPLNLFNPEDQTVHPRLRATVTTTLTGGPNKTTTYTHDLPVTISSETSVHEHPIGCSCISGGSETACSYCDGKGVKNAGMTPPEYVSVQCGRCIGTGSMTCTNQCNNGHFSCGNCTSTGSLPSGAQCSVCFGKGFNDCSLCRGTGKMNCDRCAGWEMVLVEVPGSSHPITETCGSCNGSGKHIEYFYEDNPNCRVHHPPPCSECHGSMTLPNPEDPPDGMLTCSHCGGSGKEPPGSYTTTTTRTESAVVSLTFPPGSATHLNQRFPILVNGEFYAMMSKNNTTLNFGPLYYGQELEIELGDLNAEASGSIMASDSAGPRYRKIGLNGVPLADSKPQQQDESGENPEETYIDAYSRQLRHSVSDVYSNAEGSLLPLMVRRDAQPDCWNQRSGLRPEERADSPFGLGWSSNVCSYVRFEKMAPPTTAQARAVVVDEMGSRQNFYLMGSSLWVHSGEELLDAKTAKNQFSAKYRAQGTTGIMLAKKFGTTCFYEMTTLTQSFPPDRQQGFSDPESDNREHYNYARLREVRDRLGNRLIYSYPSSDSLIPHTISDPDRPGRKVSISQLDGVITAVRGPAGETIQYDYDPLNNVGGHLLSSVQRGSNTVHYAYETALETDPTPDASSPLHFMHLELSGITDELGRTYTFQRGDFDRGVTYEQFKRDDQQVTVYDAIRQVCPGR
jgi:hypothetical protein